MLNSAKRMNFDGAMQHLRQTPSLNTPPKPPRRATRRTLEHMAKKIRQTERAAEKQLHEARMEKSRKPFLADYTMAALEEAVLDILRGAGHPRNHPAPLGLEDLLRPLGLGRKHARRLEDFLALLEERGQLLRLRGAGKGRRYALPEGLRQISGKLTIPRGGMGFIVPDNALGWHSSGGHSSGGHLSEGHLSGEHLPGGHKGQAAAKNQAGKTAATGPSGKPASRPAARLARDIYVHPNNLGGAWPGDRVLAALLPDSRGKNPEGRIIRVLERGVKELPVRALHQPGPQDYGDYSGFSALGAPAPAGEGPTRNGGSDWLARPLDGRFGFIFMVDASTLPPGSPAVQPGHLLLAQTELPPEALPGEARPGYLRLRASANLGAGDGLQMQERLMKATYGIATEFPAEALAEAALLPANPSAAELEAELAAGRRDLRHLPFVTIDGADARDFDDAIHVAPSKTGGTVETWGTGGTGAGTGGGFTLHVAIADVSHYVRPGGALDAEARARGNSYYFPASVEPMLPPALSNGLCSLNEGVPRLVMVAEMDFSAAGVAGRADFYPAVIESRGRLTYEGVEALLGIAGQGAAEAEAGQPEPGQPDAAPPVAGTHKAMLERAAALARLCIERRNKEGNLDFELPEADIKVDSEGRIMALGLRQRLFSHRLIEAFMVAANEAVARYLRDRAYNLLYRVHPAPAPEKLENFLKNLANTSFGRNFAERLQELPAEPEPAQLQKILAFTRESPEAFLISRLLLRAMMQARYSPEPEGHFGLASECYCHFTSPIRRYADLLVHRSLKAALARNPGPDYAVLQEEAESVNANERKAVEAEREMDELCAALYLRDKIGEAFSGLVSGLTDYGIFVELEGLAAEGMVRVDSLPQDYYVFDQERNELFGQLSGKSWRFGQRLALTLASVNVEQRELTFALAEGAGPARQAARAPEGGSGKRRGGRTGEGGETGGSGWPEKNGAGRGRDAEQGRPNKQGRKNGQKREDDRGGKQNSGGQNRDGQNSANQNSDRQGKGKPGAGRTAGRAIGRATGRRKGLTTSRRKGGD